LNAKNLDSAYAKQLREFVAGLIRIDTDERNEEHTHMLKNWHNYNRADAGLKLARNSGLRFFLYLLRKSFCITDIEQVPIQHNIETTEE